MSSISIKIGSPVKPLVPPKPNFSTENAQNLNLTRFTAIMNNTSKFLMNKNEIVKN
jgi:hypothetical protein